MGAIIPDSLEKDSIAELLNRLCKITIANHPQPVVDAASELWGEGKAFAVGTHSSPKEQQERKSHELWWKKRTISFLKTVEVKINPAKM